MRAVLTLLAVCLCTISFGQNKPLLYNVDDLPQNLIQNPGARIDFTRHFGIPLFSQIHVGVGSTGVNAKDIFEDDSRNINARIQSAITNLTASDFFSINEQIEVLSFGWKMGDRGYFSAGVYQEADVFAYFPNDPAVLAFEGNADYLNRPFKFDDVTFTGEVLAVYHAGFNYKLDTKWTVGGRLKLYSGIFNVKSTKNQGVFITTETPGEENFYQHAVNGMNVVIYTSGYASLNDEDDMTVDEAAAELLSRSFFGQNIGVGLDLGFHYRITEQLSVNAAFQDLGKMFHKKDIENSRYFGSYQTSGLQPLFPELDPGEETIPYWDVFEEQLDENLQEEKLYDSYTTWRPLKYNASIQFGTGRSILPCDYLISKQPRYMNLFGMIVSGVVRPKGPTYGVTTYWDRKVNDYFRFRVSYGLDQFSRTKFGVMASSRFKNFNAYIALNDIIGYANITKAYSASLQLGVQYVFKEL